MFRYKRQIKGAKLQSYCVIINGVMDTLLVIECKANGSIDKATFVRLAVIIKKIAIGCMKIFDTIAECCAERDSCE